MSTVELKIKLFGPLAGMAGNRDTITISVPGGPELTAEMVVGALAVQCPALGSHVGACRLAVNHAFAEPGQHVDTSDELALVGMVSGG